MTPWEKDDTGDAKKDNDVEVTEVANEDIVDEDETNGVLELLKKHDENLFQIVSLLSVELTKPFKFSRNAAQLYLEKISQKVGLSILRLLKPFKARLRKYVLTRSLRSVMGFEQLARMNTAIFSLSLPTGPLFKVDHHMTSVPDFTISNFVI